MLVFYRKVLAHPSHLRQHGAMLIPLRVDPTDGSEGLVLDGLGPWLFLSTPRVRLRGQSNWQEATAQASPESGVDGLVVRHRLPGGLELRRHWRHRGLPHGAVACFVEAFQGGDDEIQVEAWQSWSVQSLSPWASPHGPEALGDDLWRIQAGPQSIALAWLEAAGHCRWEAPQGQSHWGATWTPSQAQKLGPGALAWSPTLLLWPMSEDECPLASFLSMAQLAPKLGLA